MIDLWMFTKLLFEVHWLQVRDNWKSNAAYKDEDEARCWWMIDETNVLIVNMWNNKNKLWFDNLKILLLNMSLKFMHL